MRVVWYTDPYSIWCWGCEPTIRRLEAVYPDAVDVDVVMGGLFEDFTPMQEQWTRMSGGRWKESVRAFFVGVAAQHRMPMDPEAMMAFVDEFRTTWPACVAVKAAEPQGRDLLWAYLRGLREAACVSGRPIHRREVQLEVARAVGLDEGAFVRALDDGSAEDAFREDREECAELGITGFPTFLCQRGDDAVRLDGWHPWEIFDEALRQLAPDLEPRAIGPAREAVMTLLRGHPRCATREVAAVLGSTDDEAEILLEDLETEGKVARKAAGSGLFWEPPVSETGRVLARTPVRASD